ERASTLSPLVYWAKHRVYLAVIQRALQRSQHIIAVSGNTKQDLAVTYGIRSEKMTVTYEGCDLPKPADIVRIDLSERFGITQPYCLYVGTSYPHKNL